LNLRRLAHLQQNARPLEGAEAGLSAFSL